MPIFRPPRQRLNAYVCPSNTYPVDDAGRHYTAYGLMTGAGSAFPEWRGLSVSDIPSSSSTLMGVETCGLNIVWTEPRDVFVTELPDGVNLPGKEPLSSFGWLSSYHMGGTHVGTVDGSVRFLSEKIDQ
jgi:hypothetical protein